MPYLLCRNRVRDFAIWKRVFDSHLQAHLEADLHLLHLWRTTGDDGEVWFVFQIDDPDRARAFVMDPAGAEAGKEAGVVDGNVWFLEGQ